MTINNTTIREAQAQHIPTRGEMLKMIAEAKAKNPNKKTFYAPDFSLTDAYIDKLAEVNELRNTGKWKQADGMLGELLAIKLNGTLSAEDLEAEIDKTLVLSASELFRNYEKYSKAVQLAEYEIEHFDYSKIQDEADKIEADYKAKIKGKSGIDAALIEEEYLNVMEGFKFSKIEKPLNDLKVERWENLQYLNIYEARINYYLKVNKEAIEAEVDAAKRAEIRDNLDKILSYIGED